MKERGPHSTPCLVGVVICAALISGMMPNGAGAAEKIPGKVSKAAKRPVQGTGLPLPRYVSLRSREANLRTGPGVRYPVEWVYKRRGLPLKIIAEFDTWRKVEDWRGTVGWMHRSMLSGKRTVITQDATTVLHRVPEEKSPATAKAGRGVVARVFACVQSWCRIEARGIRGWSKRRKLWGISAGEKLGK